jgi:peptidoglycan/LPS O-acetylase OafA/YrhL
LASLILSNQRHARPGTQGGFEPNAGRQTPHSSGDRLHPYLQGALGLQAPYLPILAQCPCVGCPASANARTAVESLVKSPPAGSAPEARQPAEWATLAAVRFLMAVTVVVYHLPIVRPRGHVPLLEALGGLGCICGFLAISGYSIAHSISVQPEGFFVRRAWRVLPIYYATLALSLLPYPFLDGAPPFRFFFEDWTLSELVGSLLFLQCFLTEKIPIFGPSWTLAIEWWLYMLAPLFIRAPQWLLALLVIASLAFQQAALARGYFPVHAFKWGIPALMLLWAWLSGFLFYRVRGWSAVLLVLVGYYAVDRFVDRSPAAYLIASLAVVIARTLPPLPRRFAAFLVYLGNLSYPMYLVHVPLLAWTARWTDWYDPYAYLGLTLAASALLYHLVDAPLRAARTPATA